MNHYPKINLLLLFFILSSCLFTTCKKEEEQPKPEAVNAAFSFDKVLINAGDSIKFIDESTGNPASWSWTFEGGTPATSVAKNPTIIYKNSGSFTVSLVVKNDVSEDTEVKEKVITVQSFLSADFTVDEQEISEGESAKFTDASIGEVIEWKWTFEGGIPATSSAQNPTVVYPQAGKYKVSLSASNPTKQNTKTIEKYIHVTCDGLYCTPQFPNYNKTENVVYGVDQTKHKMIIYEPVGDSRSERPAVLLLGGGGFTFASNLDYLEPFAINLTKYGIVVAVARYRINTQVDPAVRLIYAQQDSRTAVRYLRKEASTLKIDADNIFNGGNGSGAFTALFHAYIDENDLAAAELSFLNSVGGLEGEAQGNAGLSSDVKGIISLTGGMYRTLDPITNNDVPLFAIHGTNDEEVPYTQETISGNTTYGAVPIINKVAAVGLKAELYTISGGNHEAPRLLSDDYILELMYFLRSVIPE